VNSRDHVIVVPVLAYHQVEPLGGQPAAYPGLQVDAKTFRLQLLALRALGYHALTLDALADALANPRDLGRAVVFTFDDGYAGIYKYAFPILARNGFNATLFLIAEDFEHGLPREDRRAFPIVRREQVAEMLAAGFSIGSHTLSHPRLTGMADAQVRDEVVRSKLVLENAFGRQVTAFCYPYGLHSRGVENCVAAGGYQVAVSTRFGRKHEPAQRFALKRISIGAAHGLPQFVYRVLWARDE
jgi:peptidoglycan/xylan/chitin deacetylase (PgdA/CDA1 family)